MKEILDQAKWDGATITMTAAYDWPTPHKESFTINKCDPQSADCHYWIAADGDCYGLFCPAGNSCISIVERMLHSAGARQTYVTFALKNRAGWKTWVKKWSRRTVGKVDLFDASVRCSAAA